MTFIARCARTFSCLASMGLSGPHVRGCAVKRAGGVTSPAARVLVTSALGAGQGGRPNADDSETKLRAQAEAKRSTTCHIRRIRERRDLFLPFLSLHHRRLRQNSRRPTARAPSPLPPLPRPMPSLLHEAPPPQAVTTTPVTGTSPAVTGPVVASPQQASAVDPAAAEPAWFTSALSGLEGRIEANRANEEERLILSIKAGEARLMLSIKAVDKRAQDAETRDVDSTERDLFISAAWYAAAVVAAVPGGALAFYPSQRWSKGVKFYRRDGADEAEVDGPVMCFFTTTPVKLVATLFVSAKLVVHPTDVNKSLTRAAHSARRVMALIATAAAAEAEAEAKAARSKITVKALEQRIVADLGAAADAAAAAAAVATDDAKHLNTMADEALLAAKCAAGEARAAQKKGGGGALVAVAAVKAAVAKSAQKEVDAANSRAAASRAHADAFRAQANAVVAASRPWHDLGGADALLADLEVDMLRLAAGGAEDKVTSDADAKARDTKAKSQAKPKPKVKAPLKTLASATYVTQAVAFVSRLVAVLPCSPRGTPLTAQELADAVMPGAAPRGVCVLGGPVFATGALEAAADKRAVVAGGRVVAMELRADARTFAVVGAPLSSDDLNFASPGPPGSVGKAPTVHTP